MSNTDQCDECENTGRNCLRSVHDNPHALENLSPLDSFTDAALLADYAAQVTLDHEAELLDQSPTTQAYADEILRRMTR